MAFAEFLPTDWTIEGGQTARVGASCNSTGMRQDLVGQVEFIRGRRLGLGCLERAWPKMHSTRVKEIRRKGLCVVIQERGMKK